MNLTDALFGESRITLRRLFNLVWGLPADAALREAASPQPEPEPESKPRTIKASMLASVVGEGR